MTLGIQKTCDTSNLVVKPYSVWTKIRISFQASFKSWLQTFEVIEWNKLKENNVHLLLFENRSNTFSGISSSQPSPVDINMDGVDTNRRLRGIIHALPLNLGHVHVKNVNETASEKFENSCQITLTWSYLTGRRCQENQWHHRITFKINLPWREYRANTDWSHWRASEIWRTANNKRETRLDISALGFWTPGQRVFFDVRVINLHTQVFNMCLEMKRWFSDEKEEIHCWF